MGIMPQDDFEALWSTIKEPLQRLDDRVTQVEKKSSRAEVAGAVENVATLPDPGQPGRMLYLTTGNTGLYVDQGDTWTGPVGGPVIARYATDAGQGFTSGTAERVNFEDKVYDTHNAVTVGVDWVFTAPVPGYYSVSFSLLFTGSASWAMGEMVRADLHKNGALFSTPSYVNGFGDAVALVNGMAQGSDIVYLDAGETLHVMLQQNSGGDQFLAAARYNFISIAKVG